MNLMMPKTEMEGEKSFQCEKCRNVGKSNAEKHAEIELRETDAIDKDTVDSFVVSIRTTIIEENLYGAYSHGCFV